ncbi:uncharacterized protein DS421_6g178390 [Arachis hypogaea]|nr:uncharacterized protein DS421_6g178390 [Arachis hypogaea]
MAQTFYIRVLVLSLFGLGRPSSTPTKRDKVVHIYMIQRMSRKWRTKTSAGERDVSLHGSLASLANQNNMQSGTKSCNRRFFSAAKCPLTLTSHRYSSLRITVFLITPKVSNIYI